MDTGDMDAEKKRTLLILGAGSLGQAVAEMAQMNAFRPNEVVQQGRKKACISDMSSDCSIWCYP